MRFLFVDRILSLSPGQSITGLKHITYDDIYLCPDEQKRLVFMPSMIGETLGQLAAWNVMSACDFKQRPVAGVVSSACLYRNVHVGETLLIESTIDALDETAVQYHGVARVGDQVVFAIHGALGPMLAMDEFIDENVVRNQFKEIYRPGEWVNAGNQSEHHVLIQPTAPEFLVSMQFDHVLESDPGVSLRASKRISRMAPYFPDHFPNKPVLPLTVLLECKLNLAREFLARAGFGAGFANHYRVAEIKRIKMKDFVYPGDQLVTTLTVKQHDETQLTLLYNTEVNNKRICVIQVVLIAEQHI